MELFSIKYCYDDGVKISIRHAIICAKNQEEARNILIRQEESIYDVSVDIVSITKIYLDESKIILIQEGKIK
jgi:hypothetical protein